VVDLAHGRVIIKKIEQLFDSAGQKIEDLAGLVVSVGPGSFTGLRVGLAVAKGIAIARDIPLVGVSLFEQAAWMLEKADEPVNVLVPFKRDALFLAEINPGCSEPGKVRVLPLAEVAAAVAEKRLAAIGFDATADLAENLDPSQVTWLPTDVSDLLTIGAGRLAAGEASDLESLQPLYLQKSQAEILFEQRRREK
jgi:tRNA threonylcarbamoyladenosine biosynthesis protein TsaB